MKLIASMAMIVISSRCQKGIPGSLRFRHQSSGCYTDRRASRNAGFGNSVGHLPLLLPHPLFVRESLFSARLRQCMGLYGLTQRLCSRVRFGANGRAVGPGQISRDGVLAADRQQLVQLEAEVCEPLPLAPDRKATRFQPPFSREVT